MNIGRLKTSVVNMTTPLKTTWEALTVFNSLTLGEVGAIQIICVSNFRNYGG